MLGWGIPQVHRIQNTHFLCNKHLMVGRGSNIQLETMKDREYAQFIHQTKKGNKSFLVNNPPPPLP